MLRLVINLRPEEREALVRWAARQRRDPREQAALVLRRELERRGLLQSEHEGGRQSAEVQER